MIFDSGDILRNSSLFLILPFFVLSACVAQTGNLDKEMDAVREEVQVQGEDLRANYAKMRSEIDSLRFDLQTVQGSLEEGAVVGSASGPGSSGLANDVLYLKEEFLNLSKQVQQLYAYVGLETTAVLEERGTGTVAGGTRVTSTPTDTANTQTVVTPADANTLYNSAKSAFDSGNMEKAQREFEEILAKFPEAEIAGNAQFWLGEIYYRGNWYEKALLEYKKVLDNYPKGNKVASALLKQGLAFEKLGQKANARIVLEELVRKYPGSSEALIAQKKLPQL